EETIAVAAPMQGTIVSVDIAEGDSVMRGQQVAVMEAMKMEHVIAAPVSGILRSITVTQGDTIAEGHPLALIEEREVDGAGVTTIADGDLELIRPDLAEAMERHEVGL